MPAALAIAAAGSPPPASGTASELYRKQVKPLLERRCYACHGALKQEGRLRLDTAAAVRRGGVSGAAVAPGRPEGSLLLQRIAHTTRRMPPDGEPLKPEEVAFISGWIRAGAPAPSAEQPQVDPRTHWAFQPVHGPAVPSGFGGRNPIDAFVAAARRDRALPAAAVASRDTLLRRVYLDLTGLPPTRAELLAFRADRSPQAYEKVVDRLLESPQYGERWGRHWMDVWRYSDWYGRRSVNDVRNSYSQVWRWRDWIVRSLNEDQGYDRMVQEMLAADELCPEDDAKIVATGFIVRNWYSLNYNQWMRDQVEHTGKAFLGLTLNCAHCHDHKYDPITQKDYFAFRAFFEPLELRRDRWPNDPDPGPFQKYIYASSTAPVPSGMIRVFDEKPEAKTYLYRLGDERNRFAGEPTAEASAPGFFLSAVPIKVEPVKLPPRAFYPGLKPYVIEEERGRCARAVAEAGRRQQECRTDDQRVLADLGRTAAEAEQRALEARIRADAARYLGASGDGAALAREAAVQDRSARLLSAEWKQREAQASLESGKEREPGKDKEAARKAALAAAEKAAEAARKEAARTDDQYSPLSPVYPSASSGRRLALARWLTDRRNPLTARVAVNHLWGRHFGRALVESVFDFGLNGKRPSHPELLDWLASQLMAGGWKMKRIHRLIVTSDTYRMDSRLPIAGPPPRDPENRYLWRFPPRRLEAEAVRDSMLSTAGSLDPRLGGPELDNAQEATSRRRSLYHTVHAEDGGAMRVLSTFDIPDVCDGYRRTETIVPQQALALANSKLAVEQSRVLGTRLWSELREVPEGNRAEALVRAAFQQVLARDPAADELTDCAAFLRKRTAGGASERAAGALVQVLFNHHEFVTLR
jgi:hypothetical protein